MRILTVRQPWAWAIIHGGKDVENRVRNIAGAYRGSVAIHVGMADAEEAPEGLWLDHARFYRERSDKPSREFSWRDAARGLIIGVVDLTDVHHADWCWDMDGFHQVSHCSPWAESDVHHLALANPRPLADPIRYKGALGLRELPADVAADILGKIGAAA